MKKKNYLNLIVLVFFYFFYFQSLTKADEISDFEIEGMSVGESFLEYLSKSDVNKLINDETSFKYPNSEFISINYTTKNLNLFDSIGVVLKKDDPKFLIYAVEAILYFMDNNIDECYEKQKKIKEDLKLFFGNKIKIDSYESKYIRDETGNSTVRYVDFDFKDQSNSRIICFNLSNEINLVSPDQLYFVANSREFMIYLNENM